MMHEMANGFAKFVETTDKRCAALARKQGTIGLTMRELDEQVEWLEVLYEMFMADEVESDE